MNLKKYTAVIIAALFICPTNKLTSQENILFQLDHPVTLSRDDSFLSSVKLKSVASPETVHVLAVRIEFAEDNDTRTTGNGKFDLSAPDLIIDSPPHNKSYFEDHLTFLENYWRKASGGKLVVKWKLFDDSYSLPKQMQNYSPPKNSKTFSEAGNLVHDAWRMVDSLNPNFPFSNYNAFCIFHAGTGRDIDLVSVFGYDPTPFDIPSLYLGLNNLKKIFGNNYNGVPVSNGGFFISNSLILPSTENRRFQTVTGTSLLQLGINGIMVGTFGSYLGLPDLFNSSTGKSAIGRFGLMDGQSMFSWSGLFPPEPSAWEKYFLEKKYNLGMINVIEVAPGERMYNMPAVGLTGKDTVYKVPINAKEYFLIENRNRDANNDGSSITFRYNNQTIQKHFSRDTSKYHAFDQSAVYGVVTDIDELDWSLPGGVGTDKSFYDGGLLIWHIDENIIDANYATNTINSNPKRRGVDLEEADGAQDIGQTYGFLSPGSGSEDGTIFDFWYKGNSAPVYKNEFSSKTYPSSYSNDMASTQITIKDFSDRSPRMSAKFILGDDVVKPLPGFPKFIGANAVNQAPQIIDGRIFISTNDSVFVFLPSGTSGTPNSTGLFASSGGGAPVAKSNLKINDANIFFGVKDSTVYQFSAKDVNADNVYDSINVEAKFNLPAVASTPVIINELLLPSNVVVGDKSGNLTSFPPLFSKKLSKNKINSNSVFLYNPSFGVIGVSSVSTTGDTLYAAGKKYALPYFSDSWEVVTAGSSQNTPHYFGVIDKNGKTLIMLDSSLSLIRLVNNMDGVLKGIAISDIDGDGSRDLVASAGRKIYAFNHKGFTLDYFPITLSDTITNSPIVADADADGQPDIFVSTQNNLIAAYSSKGRMLQGFPLSINKGSVSEMSISSNPALLTAMSGDGYLYAWSLKDVRNITWGNYKGNVAHTAFENSSRNGKPLSEEFLPSSRVYNWPNPVYNGKTNIRFFVSEDAFVKIKIFDLAGVLVDEIKTNAKGKIDNEVEWNAAAFQSGVYFAHVQAEGNSQRSSSIIKIAIVK